MLVGFGAIAAILPALGLMKSYPIVNPIALFVLAMGALLWAVRANAPLNRMIEEAKLSPDKRDIGLVLDAFREYSSLADNPHHSRKKPDFMPPLVMEMGEILARLLPQIEAEDAVLFSPTQRAILRRLLWKTDTMLVLGALQALRKIGNSADLPFVQRLAQGAWNAAEKPMLIPVAIETAAHIETRLSQQNQTQTLLRSSIRPEGVQAELLRPAAPQTSRTDAGQLLRAENGDPQDT